MIVEIIEGVHAAAGIALNILLIYLIRRFSKKSLGAYKYLLGIFASFDIFLVIVHAIIKPNLVIAKTTFGVVADTFFEDRSLPSAFCAFFTVPFTLLCIHFLYRFWSIRLPHLIPLFSNWKFIILISAIPIAELIVWYLICIYGSTGEINEIGTIDLRNEYNRTHGHIVMDAWLVLDHWRDGRFTVRPFAILAMVDLIMVFSFSIALFLGSLTFYHIKRMERISASARQMQWKLFVAVCAQTAVPVAFVYIPYSCAINFPFFRITISPALTRLCTPLISCFPAWDAVIMIAIIKDYRNGFFRMLGKKKKAVQVQIAVDMSTQNIAGIALNLLLLYLICRFSKNSLGSYKYLLGTFASFDVFLVILHAAVKPNLVITNTTFGVNTDTFFEDRILPSIFCACFSVPFTLLCIHFLYRFWSVRVPHLIPLFSNWKFIVLISAIPITELITWYLICMYGSTGGIDEIGTIALRDEFNRTQGHFVTNAWLFVILAMVDVIMGGSFTIALTLGSLTFYHIKRMEMMSSNARHAQWKLFVAVCAQTAVPVAFVYILYSCALNFPFFRIPVSSKVTALCFPLVSCFPAWDAIIIITIMKDYHDGLARLLGRKKKVFQMTTLDMTTHIN